MTGVPLNRALTIRNPWAWAIINGHKDVENRSWQTDYRGQLYIHAGLADPAEPDIANPLVSEALEQAATNHLDVRFRPGYVLGTVNLHSVHHANDCKAQANTMCSEWAHLGQYHWVLTEPRPLACPFPEKGKQGLWRF